MSRALSAAALATVERVKREPALLVSRPCRSRPLALCVSERLLVIAGECAARPEGDYNNALEFVVADPDARTGLSADALAAVEYLEGVADAHDCTVLELLELLDVTITKVRFG